MKTYLEKEKCCEAAFRAGGPYWHAFTPGIDTPLLFADEQSFLLAANVVAQAAHKFNNIKILAFEVMDNHFHFVVSGKEADIKAFWAYIRKRLARFISEIKKVEISLKPITTLQQIRNCIVYTHRNGFVACPDHTPFSYPWGTGRYFFLDYPEGVTLSSILFDDRRALLRCRKPDLPGEWRVENGMVLPASYCAIKFGMAMFRDAQHYFHAVSKSVEAYSELATELEDTEFLTDTELYSLLAKVVQERYNASRISDLSHAQKLDIARSMRYDYRSSNGQIRRLLYLPQREVDALFPLSRKNK